MTIDHWRCIRDNLLMDEVAPVPGEWNFPLEPDDVVLQCPVGHRYVISRIALGLSGSESRLVLVK